MFSIREWIMKRMPEPLWQVDPTSVLPKWLMLHIFSYLTTAELCVCSKVSVYWAGSCRYCDIYSLLTLKAKLNSTGINQAIIPYNRVNQTSGKFTLAVSVRAGRSLETPDSKKRLVPPLQPSSNPTRGLETVLCHVCQKLRETQFTRGSATSTG